MGERGNPFGRRKAPRAIERRLAAGERPLGESTRVEAIIGEIDTAFNSVFGANEQYRLRPEGSAPANLIFTTRAHVYQVYKDREFRESSLMQALAAAGLPYSFVYIFKLGNEPVLANDDGITYVSQDFFGPKLNINPGKPEAELILSKNSRTFFRNLVVPRIVNLSKSVEFADDGKLIDRDLNTFTKWVHMATEDLDEQQEVVAFTNNLVESFDQADLTISAKGAHSQLSDKSGLLISKFITYDKVARALLYSHCLQAFNSLMPKRFPWYKAKPTGPEGFGEPDPVVLKRIDQITDINDPRTLFKDYTSSRIGGEILKRRIKPRLSRRAEKKQEEKKLANLLGQIEKGTAIDQAKQKAGVLQAGETVGRGVNSELSNLSSLVVKIADLMEIEKEKAAQQQAEQDETAVSQEAKITGKRDQKRRVAKERRRLGIEEDDSKTILSRSCFL